MLTIPSVHPVLLSLVREDRLDEEQLAPFPHHSWDTLVEDAIAQRVAAILFHRLSQSRHRSLIPSHSRDRLNQQIVQQTAWNLLLEKELQRILLACQQRNIACVPIHGPILDAQLYGDSSIRQMDDLDILVHHEDLPAITHIFEQLGYTSHEQRPGFLEAYSYSLEFIHPRHGVVVEPHWTLVYPPFIGTTAMEPVWTRTVRQRWRGMDTERLCQSDLLLHLCLHLLHKGIHSPLLWYYELHQLIRGQDFPLNWNLFVDQAQAMDQVGFVSEVLMTVNHHFHSPIPDSVMNRLQIPAERASSPSPRPTQGHLLAHTSLSGREEFALLCSLQGLRQKIHYASALLFPSPRYMAQRYGLSGPMGLIRAYISRACHLFWEGGKWAMAWVADTRAPRQGIDR